WRLPSDLRHFRAMTLGRPVVMGRRTFESIGRALDGRDNIVVTRDASLAEKGVHVAYSLDEAIGLAEGFAQTGGADEIAVIGGHQIFAECLGRADRLHLTLVHDAPEGDVVFPAVDWSEWREVSREGPLRGEGDSA